MGEPTNDYLGSYATDAAATAAWAAAGYPGSVSVGIYYLNSTDGSLRIWDGTQWSVLSAGIAGRGCAPLAYAFTSRGVGAGVYYPAGYYAAPAAQGQLNQGTPSLTYGSANVGYCARAFAVAGGPGVVASGTVALRVSGTSFDPLTGTRTAADSEILVADITTLALNQYVQTEKHWLGTVTFALVVTGGAPATYSLDFNYGRALFEEANRLPFRIICFEFQGLAGATDTAFDVTLLAHNGNGWVYSAAAFVPGGAVIARYSSLCAPEDNLLNDNYFAVKRFGLAVDLDGADGEGFVIRTTGGQPNSVQEMTMRIGIQFLTT